MLTLNTFISNMEIITFLIYKKIFNKKYLLYRTFLQYITKLINVIT